MAFQDLAPLAFGSGHRGYSTAFNYGIHPHNGLIPERASYQESFLDCMLKFKDVWFPRCQDMAEYWTKNHLAV